MAPPTFYSQKSTALDNPAEAYQVAIRERDLYRQIIDTMSDAVIAVDPEGRIIAINHFAKELLNLREEHLLVPYQSALAQSELQEALAQALSGSSGKGEFEISRDDDESPLTIRFDAQSQVGGVGATLVLHDVTEIRRLERMRQDFVSNVSHELRTPVSIIRAHAETLQSGAIRTPQQAGQFLDAIARSAERLSTLVSDLLDLSRIETGNYHFRREFVEFAQICASVSDATAQTARQRKAELSFEFADGLKVLSDPSALEQILVNLVENAIKYGPEGGVVEVVAAPDKDVVRIEVRDHGPGIAREHRSRVFERFYRVDPGRSRAAGGTGLGLSIVRHLAEAMGGSAGVDGRASGGSVFWVAFPTEP
jgi:two-component system phosphate regulon sensor histidine kinase PhoR